MRHIPVKFSERIRLMQIVANFPAAGLSRLKACLELLKAVEFNDLEAESIGFTKDAFSGTFNWDFQRVLARRPEYNLQLSDEQAKLLANIIEEHPSFQPGTDDFIPALLDQLKDGH